MDKYSVFIDESGSADPASYSSSPYFSLCGVLITDKNRAKLKRHLDTLKRTFFGSKNFILHASELRYQLKKRKKLLSGFTKGLEFVLQNCDFYLLYVVVEKKMAQKRGWDSVYIYKQTYLLLLSNLLKFLTAKKRNGQIFSEASNISQDTHLYNAFFHLIRRGIADSLITNVQARQRFTSLCFVTKPNNDAEEQLADFFGIYGRLKMEIEEKIRSPSKLDDFEVLISKIANKSLFTVTNAQAARKVRLYKEIDSFKIIP